jgi:hypothetical protein
MTLIRFIIYSIIAYFVLRFVGRLLETALRLSKATHPRNINNAGEKPPSSRMIRCELCGTFVTERSAVLVAGRRFCSTACAETLRDT